MSHILEVHEDGTKRAVVIGNGIYTVYQSKVDDRIKITAGAPSAAPLVSHQLGTHQQAQADDLFSKLCGILGTGKTIIKLADYAMTDPDAETEQTPNEDMISAEDETEQSEEA